MDTVRAGNYLPDDRNCVPGFRRRLQRPAKPKETNTAKQTIAI